MSVVINNTEIKAVNFKEKSKNIIANFCKSNCSNLIGGF